MDQLVTEFALSAAAGSGAQVICEALKMGHTMISSLSQAALHQTKTDNGEYRKNVDAETKAADAAAARTPVWLRATLGIIVFVSFFLLGYTNGWFEVETSYLFTKEPWFNFFNILKVGGGVGVKVVQGFVMHEAFPHIAVIIAGSVFGIGAIHTGKRVI